MNSFETTIDIIFIGFIALSFWLPYRQGKTRLAISVSSILTFFVILTLIPDVGYITDLLLVILFAFCIIFLSYWTLVNLGFKKAGKIIAITFSIIALLPFLSFALEDYFFFKSDAQDLLTSDEIMLNGDFTIKSNQVTGLTDFYQKFELDISSEDKKKLLNQLRNSEYYDGFQGEDPYMLSPLANESDLMKKTYKDYETDSYVIRKVYQQGQEGYRPTYDYISISTKDNTLVFEQTNP